MNEVCVTSWQELQDNMYEDSWREPLGRFRPSHAFRGLNNNKYSLMTSLARLGSPSSTLEGHMLRNFRKYALRKAVPIDSVWNWLALAQHYGLPTRLLDWTYSPYVALHFATDDTELFSQDAVIWRVNYAQTNQWLPAKLRDILVEEGSDVFTAEMLSRAASTLKDFEGLADSDFVAFFEPPSFDDRIVNQFALFSLLSTPQARLERWLSQHAEVCRQVRIPARLKWEIRDKLDQANITERVLYPGLDGLSRWLTRYYTPRENR